MTSSRQATLWYAGITHPVSVLCFAVLLVNDHWLKHTHPGWLSGKLSDVAFMVLGPLWLQAAWLAFRHLRGHRPQLREQRRALWLALLGISLSFVLMQTTSWGDWLYRHGLGMLQYPVRALHQLLFTGDWGSFTPVHATPDLSDLLCLPMLYVAWRLGVGSKAPSPARADSLLVGPHARDSHAT